MTTYVTFGTAHRHVINDVVYDTDCIAVIPSKSAQEGRAKAFEYFGSKFCFEYFNVCPDLIHFPRGRILVSQEAPTLIEHALLYIIDQVKQEKCVSSEIMLQLLCMCRLASDPHLLMEQQCQLDAMIKLVESDIATDSNKKNED